MNFNRLARHCLAQSLWLSAAFLFLFARRLDRVRVDVMTRAEPTRKKSPFVYDMR